MDSTLSDLLSQGWVWCAIGALVMGIASDYYVYIKIIKPSQENED